MKVPTFLATLRDHDIQVWADGDRLRCNAPAGTLTPELRQELSLHKQELLEFLSAAGSLARQPRAIVPLQPHGDCTPVFAFGGHNGDVFCFRALAQCLGNDQPFFGLQPPGLDGHQEPLCRVEELASYFAREIRSFRPEGPYIIAGFCAGGTIAFELACQLVDDGAAVSLLALFGAPFPSSYHWGPRVRKRLGDSVAWVLKHTRNFASAPSRQRWLYFTKRLRRNTAQSAEAAPLTPDPVLVRRARVERATFAALRRYRPRFLNGRVALFLPSEKWTDSPYQPLRWNTLAFQAAAFSGPDGCNPDVMLRESYAHVFAGLFRTCCARFPQPTLSERPAARTVAQTH